MIDHETLIECFQIAERKRTERRRFMKMAGTAMAATAGASLLAACDNDDDDKNPGPVTGTPPPTTSLPAGDVDVLNFALNLEYLEANYYTFAAFGTGVNAQNISGTGTQGAVVGGRQVTFSDAMIAANTREIAADENAHVLFLRQNLGSSAVAQPAINIDGGATGAFTAAARAAGIVGPTGTFDPYANDDNFLLGAMLLSDVGVTAYKGSATLIANKTVLEAAAGILAVEAYHTGLIRTLLYRRGIPGTTIASAQNNRNYAELISNARDTLDGNITSAGPPARFADDDQGIGPVTANGGVQSNITPTDANAVIFGRTADDVLNVVYQNAGAATSGGFFPAGLNGNIRASTAG